MRPKPPYSLPLLVSLLPPTPPRVVRPPIAAICASPGVEPLSMRRIRRLRAVWDGGGVEQRRCGGMPRKWQGGRRVEGINARGRGRRHGGGRVLSAVVLALVGGVLHGGRAWRGGALGMGGSADDASGGSEHARALYRHWESAYGLDALSLLPPPDVTLPPGVPRAPHLENCAQRTAWRERMEARGRNGEAPAWARPSACGGVPQPPWVRGSDAANLAGTREAQRDIWEQQFPAACAGRRLVVVPWLNVASFGLGAQLHVVSAILAAALLHNRTLVMLPHSMAHADHAHCEAVGERGSLSCYFFPMAARECEAVAMAAYHSAAMLKCDNSSVLASPAPVVFGCGPKLGQDSAVVGRWGEAYKEREVVQEVEGALYARIDDKIRKKHWWRAQSVRFMLRWPSRHLCHLINRERHTAYGMHVAAQLATAAHQAALLSMLLSSKPHSHPAASASPPSSSPPSPSPSPPAPLALTGMPSIPPPSALESHAWPLLGYDACDDATAASATLTAALPPDPAPAVPAPSPAAAPGDAPPLPPEQWSAAEAAVLVGGAVHMPRPVVSVHVRQGDKAREMRLFSFFAFMHRANRLRRLDPNLKAVWLSTEMQSVVEQTALFPDWTFYYSRLPRQGAREAMANYSTATGLATVVGASFANLLIASECDYFVGTLGSNWNRLINELKSTNGRLFSGYVSLNFGEW
ncbi:unnamed protein product [Closterium sp. NIES-64]|nr:unnamed protein product [Closterium sp. NIES-64]